MENFVFLLWSAFIQLILLKMCVNIDKIWNMKCTHKYASLTAIFYKFWYAVISKIWKEKLLKL